MEREKRDKNVYTIKKKYKRIIKKEIYIFLFICSPICASMFTFVDVFGGERDGYDYTVDCSHVDMSTC